MEYTVKDIKEIAKVSARTLHYYDEIGLLKPARVSSSGYRNYNYQKCQHAKYFCCQQKL